MCSASVNCLPLQTSPDLERDRHTSLPTDIDLPRGLRGCDRPDNTPRRAEPFCCRRGGSMDCDLGMPTFEASPKHSFTGFCFQVDLR